MNRALITLFALALFILASELIQENFIPGRGYELLDILSGFAGLLSGFMAYKRLVPQGAPKGIDL